MARVIRFLLAALMICAATAASAAGGICNGKFPNPLSDICWSCTFPWKIGGVPIGESGEDALTDGGVPFCLCGLTTGVKTSFWEPARIAEVVRTPYCFMSLGGIQPGIGIPAPRGTNKGPVTAGRTADSFYHVHWYMNPLIFWLEVAMDNKCLEKGTFDVAYFTEVDPLWSDSVTSFIINPDVVLYANPFSALACAADCAAATAGFPLDMLYWCAGCYGSLMPMDGHVGSHVGGVQASSLLTMRFTAKLHRQLLMWTASGSDGLCTPYPNPVMRKSNYKFSMLYPTPWTAKVDGKCCTPFGRSSVVWGAGKEFPYGGEDFSYQIFRKRDCCSGKGWGG
jgi:conjugal transfer pilus assembly protein TraU